MDDISLVSHLCKYIGQTVTIFTTSGGESGAGFTGILLSVNSCYVRLTTQVGPAPACSLGNCCSGIPEGCNNDCCSPCDQRFSCSGSKGVGSVTDIPIEKIVSFVHNAL